MDSAHLVFSMTGILTAYCDFLTYPIVTFGIPFLLYLILAPGDIKEQMTAILAFGTLWLFGYIGMWGSKWLLATLITGQDVISNALESAAVRTSDASVDGTVQYGLALCIYKNYVTFLKTPATLLVVGFLLISLWHLKDVKIPMVEIAKRALPFIAIAILPVVWFSLSLNHSSIHFVFTNKACLVSVLSLLLFAPYLKSLSNEQNDADDHPTLVNS